ncbi:MAG: hypothetical protein ACLTAO_11570, partial [Christensenellales bacterium]
LILEVFSADTQSQLFVYCAAESPYDNVNELTQAYAEDLGASVDHPDENGTTWQILSDQEFAGRPCSRILSTFQNVNAEYVLMLSDDGSAYIITMITFNGQAPDSALEGITFTEYGTAAATPAPSDDAGASTTSEPTAQAGSGK